MSSFFHDSIHFISLYRDKPIPYNLRQLPHYIRKIERSFLHDPIDKDTICRFKRFILNKECISFFDSPHQIVVKILVPYEIIWKKKYTSEEIIFTKYFWKPHDLFQSVTPNGRRPFEAVDLICAGIMSSYLESITQNHLALHK